MYVYIYIYIYIYIEYRGLIRSNGHTSSSPVWSCIVWRRPFLAVNRDWFGILDQGFRLYRFYG